MKAIVTTTINPITKALEKYIEKKDWQIIVVGDLKTPHKEYENIPGLIYLHPDEQSANWPKLSEMIGFNCIQRRNFGFIHAYNLGAEVVATVDDDNIPYDDWDANLLVNQTVEVDIFNPDDSYVFDPLSVTNYKNLWHRGYPWEIVKNKNDVVYLGKKEVTVDIQAGLWDGDPDIDAVERLIFSPTVKFDYIDPYSTDYLTVFNSQNTFVSRRVLPNYMMIPFVGRMDDIWGAYILQRLTKSRIVFTKATVYQDRNLQCLHKNMKNEIIGYENNLELTHSDDIVNKLKEISPKSAEAFEEYRSLFV